MLEPIYIYTTGYRKLKIGIKKPLTVCHVTPGATDYRVRDTQYTALRQCVHHLPLFDSINAVNCGSDERTFV